uniref:Uncharacterized protein n=1 Tax=Lepeophtheirus salmonis TaxID=72036 RepID=A0A0K2UX80_LEPSM
MLDEDSFNIMDWTILTIKEIGKNNNQSSL